MRKEDLQLYFYVIPSRPNLIVLAINILIIISTIAPFYHIRAKERAKYATLLHCRTGKKLRTEEEQEKKIRCKTDFEN